MSDHLVSIARHSPRAGPETGRPPARDTLVAGVGSFHGDDAAGWSVVRLLRETAADGAAYIELHTPAELLDAAPPGRRLVVCDACRGLGPAGSLHRMVWPSERLAALRTVTTHALGLVQALELAQTLSRLPAEVVLWAVEIDSAAAGRQLSAVVSAALPAWADLVRREIS